MPISSPCIKLCVLDETSSFCRGCGRTGEEIGRWSVIEEPERLAIMALLSARLAVLESGRLPKLNPHPGSTEPPADPT